MLDWVLVWLSLVIIGFLNYTFTQLILKLPDSRFPFPSLHAGTITTDLSKYGHTEPMTNTVCSISIRKRINHQLMTVKFTLGHPWWTQMKSITKKTPMIFLIPTKKKNLHLLLKGIFDTIYSVSYPLFSYLYVAGSIALYNHILNKIPFLEFNSILR